MKKKTAYPVVLGADWTIYSDGKLSMNLGGTDYQHTWSPWTKKFLWKPFKIEEKWYWLRTIYKRKKINTIFPRQYDYEYAVDLFDLIKKES